MSPTYSMQGATAILFASGKGGVGKSTISAALAMALARNGLRCLLIDGDIGLRSLDLMLGVQDKVMFEMADCLQRRCTLDDAILIHPEQPHLHLLVGGQEAKPKEFAEKDLRRMLRTLKQRYDYLLIDGPAGLGRGLKNFAKHADRLVLVATADEVCLRDTEKTARVLRQWTGLRPDLLLNRYDERLLRQGLVGIPQGIADALDLALLGVIPRSDAVYAAMLQGKTLLDAEDTQPQQALYRAAASLSGRQMRTPSPQRGFFQRLASMIRGGDAS